MSVILPVREPPYREPCTLAVSGIPPMVWNRRADVPFAGPEVSKRWILQPVPCRAVATLGGSSYPYPSSGIHVGFSPTSGGRLRFPKLFVIEDFLESP